MGMGLPPESIHELARKSAEGSANLFADTRMSQHLRALVGEVHASTWHTAQGSHAVTIDNFGTKPGDPLGSIVFNFLEQKVLARVQQRVEQAGVVLVLPPPNIQYPP